jgi:hypothetical protein
MPFIANHLRQIAPLRPPPRSELEAEKFKIKGCVIKKKLPMFRSSLALSFGGRMNKKRSVLKALSNEIAPEHSII